jgi:hypothetical protein
MTDDFYGLFGRKTWNSKDFGEGDEDNFTLFIKFGKRN